MPVDLAAKSSFVGTVGDFADKMIDAETASGLTELPWLARPFVRSFLPWVKAALRRAMTRAIDALSTRAASPQFDGMLSGALRGAVEALRPHAAVLTELRFGDAPQAAMLAAYPAKMADYAEAFDHIRAGLARHDLRPSEVMDALGIGLFPPDPDDYPTLAPPA